MDAFRIGLVELAFAAALFAVSAYLTGRLHQKYKQEHDADEAFRTGYEQASQFMLTMTGAEVPVADADGRSPARRRFHTGARHRGSGSS